jgi:hypothetical protein
MSVRSLNIEIDLSGKSPLDALHRINQKMYELITGGKGMAHQMTEAEQQMMHFANTTGVTNSQMEHMIATARKDIHLEKEMKAAATAAGLTEDELKRVNQQLKHIDPNAEQAGGKLGKLGTIMKGAAIYFGFSVLKGFNDRIIADSNQTENALIGFKTVVKNTLGAGMEDAAVDAAKRLVTSLKGSMDESSVQMSIKNLLNTGFSLDQATGLIEKNAYMASINRQSQFANISDAVVTYTEGIKNNNAMLTDSTGISENLSVTLKKQGLSMDGLNNAATKGAVIQAIYNAHTKEAGQYQEAFNTQMAGYQGLVAKNNVGMKVMLSHLGDMVKVGWSPLLAISGAILDFFNAGEKGIGRLHMALVLLGSVALVAVIKYLKLYKIATYEAAVATAVEWAIALWPIFAIAAGIAFLLILFDDIKNWMAGNNSMIGNWFGDYDGSKFQKIVSFFKKVWEFAKQYGKYIIMAIFPLSILYFCFDEIKAAFFGLINLFKKAFSGIGKVLSAIIPNMAPINVEARAMGGSIEPNKPYLVGENGPELRTFGSSGSITPNHKLGGKSSNINITISIDARGGSSSNARSIGEAAKNAILSAIPSIRAQLGLEDSFA